MEVLPSRSAKVGESQVRRALPQRTRRTTGAWCFVDHFGPSEPGAKDGLGVGPHPHCGLSTVTWMLQGSAVHTDSLGSEQPIRPGQLNLMTAGTGISHAEQTPATARGAMHGAQFWVAQPEATRHGAPAFEHGVVVVEGRIRLDATPLTVGELAHLPVGVGSVRVETDGPVTLMLIGGEPFESPVQMWWNFVGRTRAEMSAAVADWNGMNERFGEVRSELDRIPAPVPPWRA